MVIKIQGNRVCEDVILHWILVSDNVKGWIDIPFSIITPKFQSLKKLVNYLGEKEELIGRCIQMKLDKGRELKHYNVVVDRPKLVNDDTVLKEIEGEKKIKDKIREMAIKELKKEGKI